MNMFHLRADYSATTYCIILYGLHAYELTDCIGGCSLISLLAELYGSYGTMFKLCNREIASYVHVAISIEKQIVCGTYSITRIQHNVM